MLAGAVAELHVVGDGAVLVQVEAFELALTVETRRIPKASISLNMMKATTKVAAHMQKLPMNWASSCLPPPP